MKLLYWICILIVILGLSLTRLNWSLTENFENIDVDIGNETCSYFYKLGLSILKRIDFIYADYPPPYYGKDSYAGIPFFENFPMTITYDFDKIYDYMTDHGLTYENFCDYTGYEIWEMKDNRFYHFWIKMKPLIQQIMNNSFKQSGFDQSSQSQVIIHFRCADTPFIKHDAYYFQKYAFFEKAMKQFPNNKNILIMSCSFHNSDDNKREACSTYAKYLSDFLNSKGYTVDIICNSNIEDFCTLFYAPGVISTGSSFSFMSGFFGYGNYISTEHSNGYKCSDCDYFTIGGYNILHTEEIDYFDTENVFQLLKEK